MRKFVGMLAGLALIVPALAIPAAAEARPRVVHKTVVVRDHRWHKGERLDHRYARNYQMVDYRRYRGLRAPPRGYRYVRSGNDVLLIGITSGIVSAVFGNMIR